MHEKQALLQPIGKIRTLHPAIFFDDCAGTFNYICDGSGDDWTATDWANMSHSCVKGLYLRTKSTNPTAGDWVEMEKRLWLTPTYRGTLDLLFATPYGSTQFELYVSLIFYDGSNAHGAELRFANWTALVWRRTELMMWIKLPDTLFQTSPNHWNHVQVSVDWRRLRYQFITINQRLIDAREFPLYSPADGRPAQLKLNLRLRTAINSIAYAKLDHLLITPDNP